MRELRRPVRPRRGLMVICALLTLCPAVQAGQVVGDIRVVYYAPNSFNYNGSFNGALQGTAIGPTLDAPAFVIENTSSSALNFGVFSIGVGGDNSVADSFNVGTIAAGTYVVVVPGLSDDGAGHPSGGFFTYTGSALDTSDSGPAGNGVPFSFNGSVNGQAVLTGIFTPAATYGPSNDNTTTTNFLGINDGPCNNCFGPTVVAEIAFASVPEPASWLLLGGGITLVMASGRLRRRGGRD